MHAILSCISNDHDQRLLILAALVCTVGVYGTSSIAAHAGRVNGRARVGWGTVSILAAGCTAWATHMIGLLAFNLGMSSGFDPILTAVSLIAAFLGIGGGVGIAVGQRQRWPRFMAGVALGVGVVALHYLGQTAYVVTGTTEWNMALVVSSVLVSLVMFGGAMVAFSERRRLARRLGAPLLLAAIAVLHFCGMAAVKFVFDPRQELPRGTLPPAVIAPVVAGIAIGLLAVAVLGLRLMLAARAAARRDRERLRELASFAVEGLAICDGDLVATANHSLETLVGAAAGALVGRPLAALLPGVALADLPEREERDADLTADDGQLVPVRILRREVVLGGRPQDVVAVRDQRERLRTESKMRALAFSDALTGLPNRARFADLVAAHAATCRTQRSCFAVLLIDLDHFKLVNDTLGHSAGDALLRELAGRLTAIVAARDVVARLGGDEFAVLQAAVTDRHAMATLAKRIIEEIGRPFEIEGCSFNVGASVGIATAPADGDEPELLLRNADLALYKAKADGKGIFRSFEPELDRQAQARRQSEADLRRALHAGEFEVHYQPLVGSRTGRITAAEALVRWRHPERGLVSPAEFIPVAEETGLIGALGGWVLRRACLDAASWPGQLSVAVNLSPAQFRDPRLLEAVRDALASARLSPQRLELEITEGACSSWTRSEPSRRLPGCMRQA